MNEEEIKFLQDLDKKLWTAADKLRASLSAADYKHVILGLVFLKYVSDTFNDRRNELQSQFINKKHEYYLNPDDYKSEIEYDKEIQNELEIRDYYAEKNIFWVPIQARWQMLQDSAKLAPQTVLPWGEKLKNVRWLLDNALESIEKDNPKLKGILNKIYTRFNLDDDKLSELIDHIGSIPFNHGTLKSKDILGHVYEYFLGQFASLEGKKGGQFYTPKAIVSLIVEMLEPFKGRVYDPAMGSGGFFVQSDKFISQHGGKIDKISVYGQEYNQTTWQLAAMNMAIRGIDFNFGKGPANTFSNDQHPDLRADYIMANPPFNMNEWWHAMLEGDPRWKYGKPPEGNANFAWMQHMIYHLSAKGSMALLLANGSMSSNTSNEGEIRKNIIEAGLIECMVALPGQLFTNTQIPACIWFLSKNKTNEDVLFIDARNIGYMKDRVLRDFKHDDIKKIADTFHNWRKSENYKDTPGFCKSITLDEIRKNDYVLTPGRYVGSEAAVEDSEPFAEKMKRLTGELSEQFKESSKLEKEIKKNLAGLGYEVD